MMRGTHTLIVLGLAVCLAHSAVVPLDDSPLGDSLSSLLAGGGDPVPLAIIGTDDGVADVLGGVRDMAASALGAGADVAGETMDQMADALTETLPSMADPAVQERMVEAAEKAVTVIDAAKETFDKAVEAAAPSADATPLVNMPLEAAGVVDDAFDDITLPGVPADDMFDDGAPTVANAASFVNNANAEAAEEMFDDVLPESIDDVIDEVTDNLPESVDGVMSRDVDINDDVNDDVNDNNDVASMEIFDDNNSDDRSSEVTSRESSGESRESHESHEDSNEINSSEVTDPLAAFMDMVEEFKGDKDSQDNDVSDEVKGQGEYKNVMRQLGGQLRSMGINANAERVVDAYDQLLDLGDDSSESREHDDDSYDHLLDDVMDDLFGDDDANDGLLEMAYNGKHHAPKHAAHQGHQGYYGMNGGYSRNQNMMNMIQANMAHSKAANTGTCPLYPVNIDEDKVTITTQGGCKIVIKLKGATVESVHTDGDNLTERERVARSVEVSYGSERRED